MNTEENVRDPKQPSEETTERKHKRRVYALRSFLLRFTALVLVVYVLVFHIVGIAVMPSNDMHPRIDAGDLLLYYRIDKQIKSQDVVVIEKAVDENLSAVSKDYQPNLLWKVLIWLGFKDPSLPSETLFVCRVIACPGDMVDISDDYGLKVNGNIVMETDIYSQTRPYGEYVEYPVKLGENEYFVLVDSRNGGKDSRFFGTVSLDEIKGIVITLMRRNQI